MGNTSRRGFASMDREKQREIASKGGRAAHAKGTAHEFTPEEARIAGRKGGENSRGGRRLRNVSLDAEPIGSAGASRELSPLSDSSSVREERGVFGGGSDEHSYRQESSLRNSDIDPFGRSISREPVASPFGSESYGSPLDRDSNRPQRAESDSSDDSSYRSDRDNRY